MRLALVSLSLLISGWVLADQCQITSPLPVPVSIAGCTFSSILPGNSTSYIQNTLSPTTTTQMYSVQVGTVTDSLTLTYAAGTQCLQTNASGKITGTGSACSAGGGGGASTLGVSSGSATNSVVVSSPTSNIVVDSNTFVASLQGTTTAFIQLNASSVTLQGTITAATLGALTTSSATATYLQQSSATATYLQQSSATATYLQQSSATITYAPISGSGNYIQNRTTLQAGATAFPDFVYVGTSETVKGSGGLGVAFNVNVGSMTGANLTTCGDSTHALGYTGGTGLFSCQNVTGSGGSGASTLAVTTGTSAGFGTVISSPTGVINVDGSQMAVSLTGSATAFITIAYSTNAQTGNYTLKNTDTDVIFNCGSNCTATLPTAVGISGKVYRIKMINAPPTQVTIATNGGQTIDGATTQIIVAQNTDIEIRSNGTGWDIL